MTAKRIGLVADIHLKGKNMPVTRKKTNLFETAEGVEIVAQLQRMAADVAYNTLASYSADAMLHPDHLVSFVEKHTAYLTSHPSVDPQQYLANLRLMTKKRQ